MLQHNCPAAMLPLLGAIMRIAMVICFFAAAMGCNRSEVRIPGASTDFPAELSGYRAKNTYPEKLVIAVPVDMRPKYYGAKVAASKWEGCETDSFFGDQARYVIRTEQSRN
jgi:hypothetical protein